MRVFSLCQRTIKTPPATASKEEGEVSSSSQDDDDNCVSTQPSQVPDFTRPINAFVPIHAVIHPGHSIGADATGVSKLEVPVAMDPEEKRLKNQLEADLLADNFADVQRDLAKLEQFYAAELEKLTPEDLAKHNTWVNLSITTCETAATVYFREHYSNHDHVQVETLVGSYIPTIADYVRRACTIRPRPELQDLIECCIGNAETTAIKLIESTCTSPRPDDRDHFRDISPDTKRAIAIVHAKDHGEHEILHYYPGNTYLLMEVRIELGVVSAEVAVAQAIDEGRTDNLEKVARTAAAKAVELTISTRCAEICAENEIRKCLGGSDPIPLTERIKMGVDAAVQTLKEKIDGGNVYSIRENAKETLRELEEIARSTAANVVASAVIEAARIAGTEPQFTYIPTEQEMLDNSMYCGDPVGVGIPRHNAFRPCGDTNPVPRGEPDASSSDEAAAECMCKLFGCPTSPVPSTAPTYSRILSQEEDDNTEAEPPMSRITVIEKTFCKFLEQRPTTPTYSRVLSQPEPVDSEEEPMGLKRKRMEAEMEAARAPGIPKASGFVTNDATKDFGYLDGPDPESPKRTRTLCGRTGSA